MAPWLRGLTAAAKSERFPGVRFGTRGSRGSELASLVGRVRDIGARSETASLATQQFYRRATLTTLALPFYGWTEHIRSCCERLQVKQTRWRSRIPFRPRWTASSTSYGQSECGMPWRLGQPADGCRNDETRQRAANTLRQTVEAAHRGEEARDACPRSDGGKLTVGRTGAQSLHHLQQ